MNLPIDVITTVTGAASSYDLTDLATVKAELGITESTNDAILKRYIKAASAAAAQYCNRVLVAETVQDRFDIDFPRMRFEGPRRLQASRWPVNTMTSLTENGTALVKDTDYRVDTDNGLFVRLNADGNPAPWDISPVIAVYNGGLPTRPADLEDAIIRMIRSRWFAKDRDPMARSINVPGVIEQSFWIATGPGAGNMTPDVEDILDNYRMPVAA